MRSGATAAIRWYQRAVSPFLPVVVSVPAHLLRVLARGRHAVRLAPRPVAHRAETRQMHTIRRQGVRSRSLTTHVRGRSIDGRLRALDSPSFFMAIQADHSPARPATPAATIRLWLLVVPFVLLASLGCEAGRFTAESRLVRRGGGRRCGIHRLQASRVAGPGQRARHAPVALSQRRRGEPGGHLRQPGRDGRPGIRGRIRRGTW